MKTLYFCFSLSAFALLPSIGVGQITFPQPADQTLKASLQITATVPGGTVTLSSSTTDVCSVSDPDSSGKATVTLLGAGTCTIVAKYGTSQVPRSFQVKSAATTFPGVDTVLGIGSLITANRTDYKINSSTNVLEGAQIGAASPQLLAGVAFQLPVTGLTPGSRRTGSDTYHPWHAFVSLKFSAGSSDTILGYTFGMTYRLMKYLDVLAGYTLTPFNEPSPGFKRAAVLAVDNHPSLYPGFNPAAMNNNKAGAFDGFPLLNQVAASGSARPDLYNGDPLETRYRGGFVIGISVAMSLKSMFGGQSNSQSKNN